MSILIEGFNKDISNADYHAEREYVSSSGLKMMLKDERQFYKTYILNESEDIYSPALDIGSYLHCMILEPHLLEEEFAIYNGATRRGSAYEEFKKENEGKTIISKSQDAHVRSLVENFNNSKIIIGDINREKEVKISSFFTKGFPEETLCGELDGVKVKVRFDYRKQWEDFGSINDLKTTGEYAHTPSMAEEIIKRFDYDLSAALYVDMAVKYTGLLHDFFFVFISKKDGGTYIYKASEQMISTGREKYKKAIAKLKKARETGSYFSNKIREVNSI